MLDFFWRKNSSSTIVQQRIRRLLDQTVHYAYVNDEPRRRTSRTIRLLPALLAPWKNDQPLAESTCFGVTQNFSDGGVALILTAPFEHDEICVGIPIPKDHTAEPYYFLGRATHLTPIGGGFWTLGVELAECLTENSREKLRSLRHLARRLLPAQPAEAPANN
jgi:hypothetical protein